MFKLASFIRNSISRNQDRRLVAVGIFSRWLLGDYPLAWPHMEWARDASFKSYLAKFGEAEGFNSHRKWTLWQLLRLTQDVPGDTAECGVFQGASSWLICAHHAGNGEQVTHHLFDSFEGLSAPSERDGSYWASGRLAAPADMVKEFLQPFADRLAFHPGWIPERFPDVADRSFSFVHVDVDLYEPTRDSVAFFYERLNEGGILLCDDYGFTTCPGATKAVDEFLADKPEKMVSLASGGGFFIKGVAVSDDRNPSR